MLTYPASPIIMVQWKITTNERTLISKIQPFSTEPWEDTGIPAAAKNTNFHCHWLQLQPLKLPASSFLETRPLKPQKETLFQVLCVSFRKAYHYFHDTNRQSSEAIWLNADSISPLGYAKMPIKPCFCLPMKLQDVSKSSLAFNWVLTVLQRYYFFQLDQPVDLWKSPFRVPQDTINIKNIISSLVCGFNPFETY